MNVANLYQLFLEYPKISIDSRKPCQGAVFFALKGDSFDGNMFVAKAFSNGAEYAVVDNPDCVVNERTILVENSLRSLQELARRHREALNIPLIAITGTNGKTTTKELVGAVLSSTRNILTTEGNLNNHIGVPLTLLRLTDRHEIAVVEMGASKRGDIKELVDIACPDYGIITNIGHAHLEGFGTFETLAETKGELYDFIRRRTDGIVFIKSTDALLQCMANGIEQIAYGRSDSDYVSGYAIENSLCLTFGWKYNKGIEHRVETNLVGGYNLDNALAAIAVGLHFGIPEDRISAAIAGYRPSNNRSQICKTSKNTVLMDAYNANPDSMKAAIDNFRGLDISPKAVILGDMNELGSDSLSFHSEIVEMIAEAGFDKVYLCGKQFSSLDSGFNTFLTTAELIEHLQKYPLQGYNILLKASHSMAFEKLVEYL